MVANNVLRARDGRRAEVLRVRNGRVERVGVRLGLGSIVLSEVVEGLEPGDWVLAVDAEEGRRVRVLARPLPAGVGQ
ncbi:hypothetical protein D3C77_767070 [compost metagenome]